MNINDADLQARIARSGDASPVDRARPTEQLYDVVAEGPAHDHRLRILRQVFPSGHVEFYAEVSEPKKPGCDCARRFPLSEACHVLLSLTSEELLTVPNRDRDAAGHEHHPSPRVEKKPRWSRAFAPRFPWTKF